MQGARNRLVVSIAPEGSTMECGFPRLSFVLACFGGVDKRRAKACKKWRRAKPV